jgi:hypothetical protein
MFSQPHAAFRACLKIFYTKLSGPRASQSGLPFDIAQSRHSSAKRKHRQSRLIIGRLLARGARPKFLAVQIAITHAQQIQDAIQPEM